MIYNMEVSMKVVSYLMFFIVTALLVTGCKATSNNLSGDSEPAEITNLNEIDTELTLDKALEGVSNYCHNTYGYSPESSSMYVSIGEENENEYQVIFRSYTGAFVYFYVDKTNGNTRMVEVVPDLEIEEEAGSINILDYLNNE